MCENVIFFNALRPFIPIIRPFVPRVLKDIFIYCISKFVLVKLIDIRIIYAYNMERILLNSKEILKMLRNDGWYVVDQDGSHIQLKHIDKKGKVTVPVHAKRDIPKGTLNSILKQAGLK